MMVDGPPAFHLCPRQEKGEKQMAKDTAATYVHLSSFREFSWQSHTRTLSLTLSLARIMSHGLSYCYGLNVCLSPNLYVESLPPNVMEFGKHTYEARLLLEEVDSGRKRGRLWPKPRWHDLMVLVCAAG